MYLRIFVTRTSQSVFMNSFMPILIQINKRVRSCSILPSSACQGTCQGKRSSFQPFRSTCQHIRTPKNSPVAAPLLAGSVVCKQTSRCTRSTFRPSSGAACHSQVRTLKSHANQILPNHQENIGARYEALGRFLVEMAGIDWA